MTRNIADLRKEYSKQRLLEKDVAADPILQFEKWWAEAVAAVITEPNAMILATASIEAVPSARTVLLKEFSEKGFIFFSNYESYKAQQLAENPKACLVFLWKELERQVRITGIVIRQSATENDKYFNSRPHSSRLAAIVSPQSQVIPGREWLDNEYKKLENEWKDREPQRPDRWGGYLVKPVIIEFWQGGLNRLHDRLQYSLEDDGNWKMERLAP
ncbi:MAG TPA: pyridoxamine 5'-phosphate oxidase [Chitinophagaceae bacterium]|nr:pyridoxamine 5'-phosphate oxidase [Chitinophagaceae bacterium]